MPLAVIGGYLVCLALLARWARESLAHRRRINKLELGAKSVPLVLTSRPTMPNGRDLGTPGTETAPDQDCGQML